MESITYGLSLLIKCKLPLYINCAKAPLWLSFAVCGTILALSCVRLLVAGRSSLLKKLRTPGAFRRAAVLGLLSGGIYFGIFFIIGQLGAGVAGLIDAGLIPLATVMVGAAMFKEKLSADFFGACAVYLLGITILMITRNESIPIWLLGVAVLPPVASALSDGQTKWLLDKNNAGLTRDELLIVRFSPAVLVLYLLASGTSGSFVPQIDAPFRTLAVAVTGGWVPLMLLCTGLGMAGMKKLAAWEFTIPAAAFFGTLHLHPENVGVPIFGALLVLSGIVISEWKLISRFSLRKRRAAQTDAGGAEAEGTLTQPSRPTEQVRSEPYALPPAAETLKGLPSDGRADAPAVSGVTKHAHSVHARAAVESVRAGEREGAPVVTVGLNRRDESFHVPAVRE